jgi:hypothetical protein
MVVGGAGNSSLPRKEQVLITLVLLYKSARLENSKNIRSENCVNAEAWLQFLTLVLLIPNEAFAMLAIQDLLQQHIYSF